MKKRLLSLLLCLVMVLSLFPAFGMSAAALSSGQHIPAGTSLTSSDTELYYHAGTSGLTYSATNARAAGTVKTSITSDRKFGTFSFTFSAESYKYSTGWSWGSVTYNSDQDTLKTRVRAGKDAAIQALNNTLQGQPADLNLLSSIPAAPSSETQEYKDAYTAVINAAKSMIRNADGVYLYKWSNVNGDNTLDDTWYEATPGTKVFYEGDTPIKNPIVDNEGNTITYDFLGSWANNADPNAAAVDTVVNEDTIFYALFHANDPTAPILNEGMELKKSATYNGDNNTVTVDLSAYAKGQTTSVLKAKDAQYAILMDLQAARAGYTFSQMLPKDPVTKSGFTGYDITSFDDNKTALFYYDASEDHYASVKVIDINPYFDNNADINDFATSEDQEIITTAYQYRGGGIFGLLDRDGQIPYVLTYKDREGKLHLVHDSNRNYSSITPINDVTNYSGTAKEFWYKGVLFAENSQNIYGSQPNFFVSSKVQLYYVKDNVTGEPTRLDAMKQAVKDFLTGLRTNTKAEVWIVGFDNLVRDTITKKWINVSQNYEALIRMVDDITLYNTSSSANGQKCGSFLAMQYANSTMMAGSSASARSVVLFQANPPTNVKDTRDPKRQDEGANLTITAAKSIKDRSVNIYSVGLIGNEILPLQYYNDKDNIGTYYTDYSLDDYFQSVSSNYPAATSLSNMGAKTTGVEYVQYANSQLDLTYAFNYIIEHTNESQATLDDQAILKDFIPLENLDAHGATVTAKIVSKAAGEGQWNDAAAVTVPSENVSFDPDTGLVTVTGFNYAENYVLNSDGDTGKKLVVQITGLVPLKTGTIDTNTKKSGIYGGEDGNTFILAFEIPHVTVPDAAAPITRVVDYNAKMILASNVTSADDIKTSRAENGTFDRTTDSKAYYQLTTGKLASGLGTTKDTAQVVSKAYTGADRALIYAQYGENANKLWKSVTVIPASNIYIDDGLARKEYSDGDRIENTAPEATYGTTGKDVFFFKFTGTGADVYCTTNSAGGSVTAGLFDSEGNVMSSYTQVIRNYSADPHYNVPTLSFTGLEHGTYTIKINANKNSNYQLDGIRVYGAMADDESVYTKNGADEYANAAYGNLRTLLMQNDQVNFGELSAMVAKNGVLYIDSVQTTTDENGNTVPWTYENARQAYDNNSPNNEIYLKNNQGIAFTIANYADLKTANPNMKVYVGLSVASASTSVKRTMGEAAPEETITSAVDQYYQVEPDSSNNIEIANTGSGILAITDIQITGMKARPEISQKVSDTEPKAGTRSVADEAAEPQVIELIVNEQTLQYAAKFMALPETVTPTDDPGAEQPGTEPTSQPSAEPTTQPTQTPSIHSFVQQLLSTFVQSLFKSISRLFGN